jgi:hypothetical protein
MEKSSNAVKGLETKRSPEVYHFDCCGCSAFSAGYFFMGGETGEEGACNSAYVPRRYDHHKINIARGKAWGKI